MKRLSFLCIGAILALAPVGPAMAQSFSMTVGTDSMVVAPTRNVAGVEWTSGMAVSQGQLVNYGRQVYMALADIVSSTTAPSDGATWRLLGNNNPRDVLVLCNASVGLVWLAVGEPAVAETGIRLAPGVVIVFSDIQQSIHCVAELAGSLVTGSDVQ